MESGKSKNYEFEIHKQLEVKVRRRLPIDSDSESAAEPVQEIEEKPKAAIRGRTLNNKNEAGDFKDVKKYTEIGGGDPAFGVVKRSTRYSQSRDVERVVHLKPFEAIAPKKLGEFSDEDEIEIEKPDASGKGDKLTYEYGGTIGALLTVFLSIGALFWLYIVCDEKQCSFTKLPQNFKKYSWLSTYFNPMSFLGYVAYTVLLGLLYVLPVGKKVHGLPNKHETITYRANGLFALSVLVLIIIGLELKGIQFSDFIIKHVFHLMVSSIIVGLTMSVYVYLRSFYVPVSALNFHGVHRGPIYGYILGRETNPRLGNILELKMFQIVNSVIGAILFDLAILQKSLGLNFAAAIETGTFDLNGLNIHPALIVCVIMRLIYSIDALVYEDKWVTSFELQYEGFGFISCVGYNIYPFMTAAVTLFLFNYNVQLAWWKLICIVLTFLVGYILFRASNNQKDAFRKNPFNPAVAKLEAIPTSQGKKLLADGFWGFVRHPNYLGDIIITSSFAPFVVCAPPVISVYSIVLFLIYRSRRDNLRCKQKYGASWDRYCQKVKYILVPKVY